MGGRVKRSILEAEKINIVTPRFRPGSMIKQSPLLTVDMIRVWAIFLSSLGS